MASAHWKDSPPIFNFTFDPSLERYNVTSKTFCDSSGEVLNGLVVGALVFWRCKPRRPAGDPDANVQDEDHILLIQRSASDFMPSLWETPGGTVEDEDPTILHGVARELWEEAGLIATHFRRTVSSGGGGRLYTKDGIGDVFFSLSGKRAAKYSFEVDFKTGEDGPVVKLDPEEHQRALWVTKDEFEAGRALITGGDGTEEVVRLKATWNEQRLVILEGFKAREKERALGTANADNTARVMSS